MVRTLDANQTPKADGPYIQPIYLIHLILADETLYFSDRNYYFNAHNYEDYLFDLSGIESQIRNFGGYDNSRITLRFKNDKIRIQNTLIDFFDLYPPEKKYVEIYKLLINTGETFGSDVSTKIFKGEMGQPYELYDPPTTFKIDCSLMLFGKNVSLPLDVIDLADFPGADPDDVGKYRNIIYGNVKKIVCPWTVSGAVTTLTADITAAATSIVVSDASKFTALTSAIIGNEEVYITVIATNTLTVTRGYNSTTATTHNKGDTFYEKRTDFEAEVAQHPVKSIGDVYVKRGDEWFRVTSGVTKYINTGGRAYLVFSDKVKFDEKLDLSIDEGSHPHDVTMSDYVNKECYPTGASGGTNPDNAIDGNENSYASLTSVQTLTLTFTESNLGTINKQYVYIMIDSFATGAVYCGGTKISDGLSAPGAKSWMRLVKTGGSWEDNITIDGGGSGSVIHEVYKKIEYTSSPTADTHAATGVTIEGNSVANTAIGDLVACDVEGYADPDGNYGGVGNLIERPDYVRKHILVVLLGFVAGDIGTSFATVGALYASQIAGGYKFSFVLHEVAIEVMRLFEEMDIQTRTNMFESGGQFQLAFNSFLDPTTQKTFDGDSIKGSFLFGKTEIADIRNKLRGHYFRDYSKFGSSGESYQKVYEVSNAESITKYKEMQEDISFSCIGDLELMIVDILAWDLVEKKELKKTVKFETFWDAMIIEPCDYFSVASSFVLWNGLNFKTTFWKENPENQRIDIEGQEFLSPYPADEILMMADTGNHRAVKRDKSALLYISEAGTVGAGNTNLNTPYAVAMDDQFYYIADTENSRIVKRYIGSHLYHSQIGTEGSGNDQFNHPKGIAVDGVYVYVVDTGNHRIVKRLKSDLSYVSKIGSQGSGNDQFESPCGICTDYTEGYEASFIFVVDTGNYRIVKRLSDLSYDSKIGAQGAGNDQFESPCGIGVTYGVIYVADTGNHRIVSRNSTTLAYIDKIGSLGAGNDQFSSPLSVAANATHIFVADTGNHRIVKRDTGLTYVSKIGSQGLDDDKFESPRGIAVYYPIPPV